MKSNAPLEVYTLHNLPLPYVEGRPEVNPGFESPDGKNYTVLYDDSTDVYVEQTAADRPYASVQFVVSGPGVFTITGFGPDQLRSLGKFLIECGDDLDRRFG